MLSERVSVSPDSIALTVQIGWNMARNRRWDSWMPLISEIAQEGRNNHLNPPPEEIYRQMQEFTKRTKSGMEDNLWRKTPWDNDSQRINLTQLLNTLMTHFNYHNLPLGYDLFPAPEAAHFISTVIERSTTLGRALIIPEQYEIALNIAQDHPAAATLIAHAGSRAIGRNQDGNVDPLLNFSEDQIKQWGKSIARFDDSSYSDIMGDNYHFWAYCAVGMITGRADPDNRVLNKIIREIFYFGPDMLKFSRKVATLGKKPLIYQHKNVARLGFSIGSELAVKSE